MYQLFAIVPEYDFRDAVVAHRAVAHPYNFLTVNGALAIGRLLDRENDDVHHVVVPVGASAFDHTKHCGDLIPLNDDIPF